ncbi:class I adenylate-forming enzyme family protein [Melghirimyces profundicolus]|nr:class I adenylate-forming enzyme family protein [Melghirimyces profundicolus]
MFTVGEILKNRADYSPDLEAVVAPDTRYTYGEYNRWVNRLAHFLLELDVRKGDRVAILCSTNHPFAMVFLAAAKVGAVAVPLNWRLTPRELKRLMEKSGPKVLFYEEEFTALADVLEPLDFLERMVRVGVDQKMNPAFEEALLERPDQEPGVDVGPGEPVVLTYTSGTTGEPKGVVATHANLFASGTSVGMSLDLRKGDRFLATTPLFHISGAAFIPHAPLMGLTTVYMPKFHPVQIWELVERERITHLLALPPMLPYMLTPLMEGDWDTGSLREIFCGGAEVPEDLIRQYHSLGFPIVQIYGASEFCGPITFWTPEMGMDRCRSVGKKVLGELKLVDPETGEEPSPGEMGEIFCRGPQVSPGYWRDSEATTRNLKGGWFRTGDAGWLDEDGFLHIAGRYGDIIHHQNEKIFPAQVEAVLLELEDIEEVAVVGVRDGDRGEVPRAYAVTKEGSGLTEESILGYARERLAEHKLQEVVLKDALPKNGLGKILKYVLKEEANQPASAGEVTG